MIICFSQSFLNMINLFKKIRGRFGLLIAVATLTICILLFKQGVFQSHIGAYENNENSRSNVKRELSLPRRDRLQSSFHLHENNGNASEMKLRKLPNDMITRVGFLKVRKAGSTTLQSLLFRFAAEHHLKPVVPKEKEYVASKDNVIPIDGSYKFDIFAVHTYYYNATLFDELLTKDRKDIAIVREPLARMISAAYFYRNIPGHQQDYLRNFPEKDYIHHLLMNDESKRSATMNSMGVDFGFFKYASEREEDVQTHLEYLNTKFALVLIMERLDESLVLLKRMFKWSLKDILYFKKNINIQYERELVFNATELSRFRKNSHLDCVIYGYFLDKFQQKIKAENDIDDEVLYFTRLLITVGWFCSDTSTINNGTSLHVLSKKWKEDFFVDRNDCILISKSNEIVADTIKRAYYS